MDGEVVQDLVGMNALEAPRSIRVNCTVATLLQCSYGDLLCVLIPVDYYWCTVRGLWYMFMVCAWQ